MSPAFASEGARAAAVSVSTTEKQATVHRVHHPPPTHLLKVASRVLRPSIPAPAPFHPHPLAASPFRSPTHLQELVLVGVLFEQLGQDLQERGSVWVGGWGGGGGHAATVGGCSCRQAVAARRPPRAPPSPPTAYLTQLWVGDVVDQALGARLHRHLLHSLVQGLRPAGGGQSEEWREGRGPGAGGEQGRAGVRTLRAHSCAGGGDASSRGGYARMQGEPV